MQGYELVNLLADYDFSLRVEDDHLVVSPASRLTDDIRQAIKAHKSAIIELAHSLDELIEAWRRDPQAVELGEKLRAASVLQSVVRSFSYEPAVICEHG